MRSDPGCPEFLKYIPEDKSINATSIRIGSTNELAENQSLNLYDVISRGGWSMEFMCKCFEYLLYEAVVVARSGRVLAGWPNGRVLVYPPRLIMKSDLDPNQEEHLLKFQKHLFAKAVGNYGLDQTILDVLFATIIKNYGQCVAMYPDNIVYLKVVNEANKFGINRELILQWSVIIEADFKERNSVGLSVSSVTDGAVLLHLNTQTQSIQQLREDARESKIMALHLANSLSNVTNQLNNVTNMLSKLKLDAASPSKSLKNPSSSEKQIVHRQQQHKQKQQQPQQNNEEMQVVEVDDSQKKRLRTDDAFDLKNIVSDSSPKEIVSSSSNAHTQTYDHAKINIQTFFVDFHRCFAYQYPTNVIYKNSDMAKRFQQCYKLIQDVPLAEEDQLFMDEFKKKYRVYIDGGQYTSKLSEVGLKVQNYIMKLVEQLETDNICTSHTKSQGKPKESEQKSQANQKENNKLQTLEEELKAYNKQKSKRATTVGAVVDRYNNAVSKKKQLLQLSSGNVTSSTFFGFF